MLRISIEKECVWVGAVFLLMWAEVFFRGDDALLSDIFNVEFIKLGGGALLVICFFVWRGFKANLKRDCFKRDVICRNVVRKYGLRIVMDNVFLDVNGVSHFFSVPEMKLLSSYRK
ncbi:hypothetical protein [Shewanella algae]|uniref:hypothetical protein n=1 Tax=Shewanella algae TaxID=38313 RepID=UPI001183EC92|nr:hypothetical protein [Shewanella algae]MBO2663232.1 hypothetical protein [Shewanella algae]MCL1054639.1 hypothetical protein [Shewanella algae]